MSTSDSYLSTRNNYLELVAHRFGGWGSALVELFAFYAYREEDRKELAECALARRIFARITPA